MKLLGVSGSLRSDSHNTRLLRAAGELLPTGVELEIWEGLRDIPPYDEDGDVEPAPPAVAEIDSVGEGRNRPGRPLRLYYTRKINLRVLLY
jgi:NAD(P)H-dependent FMN reductase